MYLIGIAGSTGTGKSTFAKKTVEAAQACFVYDRQNEYKNLPSYAGQILPKMRYFGNFDEYIEICDRLKGYTIICEEATGIFSGRAGRSFIDIVLSKRHSGNTFVLIFHSIHRVPINIYEFMDFFILHKTNDIEKNIISKYPNLHRHFLEVRSNPDYHFKKTIKLTGL